MIRLRPRSPAIDGPLYQMLRDRFPICHTDCGSLDVAALARLIGMTQEGVYRWLRKNQISRAGRSKLIALSLSQNIQNNSGATAPLCTTDLVHFS